MLAGQDHAVDDDGVEIPATEAVADFPFGPGAVGQQVDRRTICRQYGVFLHDASPKFRGDFATELQLKLPGHLAAAGETKMRRRRKC
ncbi:MAG: hypothetical protein R2839_00235 [Thermomicrobiales bacterium]